MKLTKYTNLNLGEKEEGFETLGDYNTLPWKIESESVDLLRADHVLTKVSRENGHFIKFMDECWRVLKFNSDFMIAVSYMISYEFIQDPLNINPLNEATFTYFDPLEPISGKYNYKIYKPKPWKMKHLSFKIGGLMEVLLEKRREDVSYTR